MMIIIPAMPKMGEAINAIRMAGVKDSDKIHLPSANPKFSAYSQRFDSGT